MERQTPIVLLRFMDGREFFTIDEDTTADELVLALLEMKNGSTILHDILRMFTNRKEKDNEKVHDSG